MNRHFVRTPIIHTHHTHLSPFFSSHTLSQTLPFYAHLNVSAFALTSFILRSYCGHQPSPLVSIHNSNLNVPFLVFGDFILKDLYPTSISQMGSYLRCCCSQTCVLSVSSYTSWQRLLILICAPKSKNRPRI